MPPGSHEGRWSAALPASLMVLPCSSLVSAPSDSLVSPSFHFHRFQEGQTRFLEKGPSSGVLKGPVRSPGARKVPSSGGSSVTVNRGTIPSFFRDRTRTFFRATPHPGRRRDPGGQSHWGVGPSAHDLVKRKCAWFPGPRAGRPQINPGIKLLK